MYNIRIRHKNKILGIGIALIIIPLLGFPLAWRGFFNVILGLWLCYIAVSMRRTAKSGGKNSERPVKPEVSENSVTNGDVQPM